jgi:thiamine kinase-like enzyme
VSDAPDHIEPAELELDRLRQCLADFDDWRVDPPAELQHVTAVQRLSGGANNSVYVLHARRPSWVLKQYFSHAEDLRDRFGAEVAFYDFAWSHGIRCVPQLLAAARSRKMALIEFLPGRTLQAADMNERLVVQATQFCQQLCDARRASPAVSLPPAAESCFSIQQHLDCVDRRVQRLQRIADDSDLQREVARFTSRDLLESWRALRTCVLEDCSSRGISVVAELGARERIVSPSDFGFHNAVLDDRGDVRFLDFEYAGWDDPAKLICDFFCQVKVPVARAWYPTFFAGIASRLPDPEAVRDRVKLLYPVYQVKWCCIVLNEFLPVGLARRKFSAGECESKTSLAAQFEKARTILGQLQAGLE